MAQGIATRSSRGHRTICLPIKEEDYLRIVNDPKSFRRTIDDRFRETPELFPANLVLGYELKDGRMSVKQDIPIRRIVLKDGSALYPEPIAAVFGDVPHQVGTFHVPREVNKAVLSAVAQVRKGLTAGAPKLPRSRPGTKAARRAVRRKKRIEHKVGELFEHRHLFARRRLSLSGRVARRRITRGLPHSACSAS